MSVTKAEIRAFLEQKIERCMVRASVSTALDPSKVRAVVLDGITAQMLLTALDERNSEDEVEKAIAESIAKLDAEAEKPRTAKAAARRKGKRGLPAGEV
jgi:hypothetical protein